jgi:hypothetical protein
MKAAEPPRAAYGRASRRGTAAAAAGGIGAPRANGDVSGQTGVARTTAPSARRGSRAAALDPQTRFVACSRAAYVARRGSAALSF